MHCINIEILHNVSIWHSKHCCGMWFIIIQYYDIHILILGFYLNASRLKLNVFTNIDVYLRSNYAFTLCNLLIFEDLSLIKLLRFYFILLELWIYLIYLFIYKVILLLRLSKNLMLLFTNYYHVICNNTSHIEV